MQFEYTCKSCGEFTSRDFKIGTAPSEVTCLSCDGTCKRHYGSMSFILKGGGWPGKAQRMKSEMTAKNTAAGKRMRKEHDPPVKLAAYDYGNGDVREVKKVK